MLTRPVQANDVIMGTWVRTVPGYVPPGPRGNRNNGGFFFAPRIDRQCPKLVNLKLSAFHDCGVDRRVRRHDTHKFASSATGSSDGGRPCLIWTKRPTPKSPPFFSTYARPRSAPQAPSTRRSPLRSSAYSPTW